MPPKRNYKKVVKPRAKKPYRKGKSNYSALSKRVTQLAKVMKPEKKTFIQNNTPGAIQTIGQLFADVAGGGYAALTVSPNPPQATGGNFSRIGNEIKLTSAYYQLQFTQQSATTSPIKVKLYWVYVKGHPQSVSPVSTVTVLFNPTPFTNGTLYDANSSMDSNYLENYQILMRKTVMIKPDTYSGLVQTKSYNFGLKLKNPISIRFAGDGGQTQVSGYVMLFMMCDAGNCSTTTASTFSNCPVVAANTGLTYNYNFISYYTDV